MSACDARCGIRIELEEKLLIFMAEYTAYLINRLEVGRDGKTANERCRGKPSTVMAIELGEKLLWKVHQKNKLEKLNPRWEYGVFVGVKVISGETWVATDEGLQAVRSVRGLPVEERRRPRCRWRTSRSTSSAICGSVCCNGDVDPPRVIVVNMKEMAPREFYVKNKDVEAHGHTKDCPGWTQWKLTRWSAEKSSRT